MKMQNTTLLVVCVLVLTLMGCGSAEGEGDQASVSLQDPFCSRWSLGEGFICQITGYSVGHVAGHESEFKVTLENPTRETWHDSFCVLLVDKKGILETLAKQQFHLEPSGMVEEIVRMEPSGDLNGPYGLVLLIPGQGAQVTTIWIGESSQGNAGPWPLIFSCSE